MIGLRRRGRIPQQGTWEGSTDTLRGLIWGGKSNYQGPEQPLLSERDTWPMRDHLLTGRSRRFFITKVLFLYKSL